MLFNSLSFILFFLVVTATYYLLPYRLRWVLLLLASCGFYMAFVPIYILILFLTIIIDYVAAICIETLPTRRKPYLLLASILSTCLVLFAFKYYDFFAMNVNALASLLDWNYSISALKLILPIGLSFHTFQSLAYVIEVYRGNQKAERHFGIYALYVMFYPQLVAGPIERPQHLLHQFYEPHRPDYAIMRDGLRLILWGMFKKVVVADRLSIYVDTVYNHADHHNGTTLLLATVFFAFQIYCDFSGYSDIAIGCARVMGFRLMRNFNTPYFSTNISEFWSRWHISLSQWFRDYLYISMGGNRVSEFRRYFNLMTTFAISGIWHGANWTYLVWGTLNGAYLIFGIATSGVRSALAKAVAPVLGPGSLKALAVASTFTLTCFAWIFFRAPSLDAASVVVRKILFDRGPLFTGGARDLVYGFLGIGILLVVDGWCGTRPFDEAISSLGGFRRWSIYVFLCVWMLMTGVFSASQFIYFQF